LILDNALRINQALEIIGQWGILSMGLYTKMKSKRKLDKQLRNVILFKDFSFYIHLVEVQVVVSVHILLQISQTFTLLFSDSQLAFFLQMMMM
jgi:hypothetical protein